MNDIALIGNLFIDHILTTPTHDVGVNNVVTAQTLRIGGLANILPALDGTDVSINAVVGEDWFDLAPADWFTGELDLSQEKGRTPVSYIVTTEDTRTAFTDWGIGRKGDSLLPPRKVKWTHIAYLDVLDKIDMDAIRAASSVGVSADVCLYSPDETEVAKTLERAKKVDYLFLSGSELRGYINDDNASQLDRVNSLRERLGIKAVICHWDSTAIVSDENLTDEVVAEGKKYTGDTTGAGDLFAGAVLKKLMDGCNLRRAVKSAHELTSVLLRWRGR